MKFKLTKYLEFGFWRNKWFLIAISCLLIVLLSIYFLIFFPLPDEKEIRNYKPSAMGRINDLFQKKPPMHPVRIYVPLTRISPKLQKAVIISEDDLFYQHHGINWSAFWEALKLNLRKKRYVRGASTITMQLARNAFLNKRKTILRKIREMILARRMENVLGKKRILELYLNIVEWGKNIYGAEAAARYYFDKHAAQLNLAEATLLAGLLPNPIYFDPYRRPKSCKRMQKRVLWLMKISRQIDKQQYATLLAEPLRLRWSPRFLRPASIDSEEERKYLLPALNPPPEPLKIIKRPKQNKDTLLYLENSTRRHDR